MHTSNYLYHHGEQELHGFVAYGGDDEPKPGILIAHDWSGRNNFVCEKAEMLARMGYVGFALDMYGHGRIGETIQEKTGLMQPLINDRGLLRARICKAYDALIAMPEVDHTRIAVVGFCFGGLCALDLARTGAELKGAVSIHGLLNKPFDIENDKILAKLLILHGYDDPMVEPSQVSQFCQEMTAAGVDWQAHIFSNTQHAFTNPEAHDSQLGTVYNPLSEARAMRIMSDFLREVLLQNNSY